MSEKASEKARLRKDMVSRRKAMPLAEVREKSREIVQRIIDSPSIELGGTVALYSSIRNEVILDDLLPHIGRAVFPRVEENWCLSFCCVEDVATLVPGCWGICEPCADSPLIDPKELDLILVPGCAYTIDGRRLGYGGGYYDRIFELASHASRVAPAYELQIVDSVPTEEHDALIDIIVTEKREIATVENRKENHR